MSSYTLSRIAPGPARERYLSLLLLKAVAIAPELQGQGIGKRMLAAVLEDLRARGVRRVIVGTGNAGIGPARLLPEGWIQAAAYRARILLTGAWLSRRDARQRHPPARHGVDGAVALEKV